MKRVGSPLLAILLLSLWMATGLHVILSATASRPLKTGGAPPAIATKDIDGKPVNLSQYKGKVVLLDFWATWCAPCVREAPAIRVLHDKYRSRGFAIIGITLDDDPAPVRTFIKDRKMSWPQILSPADSKTGLHVRYGVSGIPNNVLIGRNGRILALDQHDADLDRAITRALSPSSR